MNTVWLVYLRRGNSTAPEDFKKVQVRANDNYRARRDAEINNPNFKAESCSKVPKRI
jgi:hypothetical protein